MVERGATFESEKFKRFLASVTSHLLWLSPAPVDLPRHLRTYHALTTGKHPQCSAMRPSVAHDHIISHVLTTPCSRHAWLANPDQNTRAAQVTRGRIHRALCVTTGATVHLVLGSLLEASLNCARTLRCAVPEGGVGMLATSKLGPPSRPTLHRSTVRQR
jgi:hypothetical protein